MDLQWLKDLGSAAGETAGDILMGKPTAYSRIGRRPISFRKPFFGDRVGEWDPVTNRQRINPDASPEEKGRTIVHEDVHAVAGGARLPTEDLSPFKSYSTDQSLTGQKLDEEILAEGLTRGTAENKASLLKRVVGSLSPEQMEQLRRLARISEAPGL
jgi:hypothetical protein